MKGPGILWLLQTAAGISMAGPMFVVGVGFLRSGQLVGGIGFLALGAATLYFPTYLVNRIGGPRTWLRRRIGRTGRDSTATGSDADPRSEPKPGSESRRSRILERLRR
ncbi:hypothetical protein CP556_08990 [Natrinema sp. CBA1119]|uniref:hypothetical protein n=1 Tax=Natrinema sp. CBA1119 TaxID=1608465 RepID=UPI000BF98BFA|nr:hypothetical protein [Natrinema sp. CBA1119]PGF16236.1 hypothetical protein CP556_08990 [Natrinema sp. CBA1119]